MRRPIFFICIISLLFAFVYTKTYHKDPLTSLKDKCVMIEGVVKEIKYKEKYVEYKIGDFLVRDFDKKEKLKVGYKVELKGVFESLENIKLDNFDYGQYLRAKGYKGILAAKEFKIKDKKKNIYSFSTKVKKIIENRMEFIFKKHASFFKALLLGDKNEMNEELLDAFSKTGTAHIIALSGLHVGILLSLFHFILRKINRFYKFIFMILFLLFYAFLGGFTPSIVRACSFAIIMNLGLFIEREYDGICTLSFMGMFLMMKNPFIIYDVSFQLSFCATLSILSFYFIIEDYIHYSLVSITISANILTWPILLYHFKIFSIVSFIANLLVIPVIGILMSFILISLLTSFIYLKAAYILSKITILLAEYIFLIVKYLATLRFSYIQVKTVNLKFLLLYYILILLYMIFRERKLTKENGNGVQGYCPGYEA